MAYVIGTAGHVDHGKSTLVEALTGIDPDRLAEEKAREMTIDLGFAWFTLPGGDQVGVVDVPGHRDFIENMLAGVGGIDLALLVIAADEGIMPQTREHLAILDLLEIPAGVVALTKIDLIDDPDWLELVMLDVEEVLSGTALEDAPIIPVSAYTEEGLDTLIAAISDSLALRPPRRDRGKPRLPVDRVFTVSGFGTVVTGTLGGGIFSVGDDVILSPSGRKARIRGLQSYKQTIEEALPGSRVAVNLANIAKDEVDRGDVVSLPGYLEPTTLIDVAFRYLGDIGRPLKHDAEVKFFSGAVEALAHVRVLGVKELVPGAEGWLQIRFNEAVTLDKGDRFILRSPSPAQTIGGGVILDAHPAHRWRRFKPEVFERFEALAGDSPEDLIDHLLSEHIALQATELETHTSLSLKTILMVVEAQGAAGELIVLAGGWIISRGRWDGFSKNLHRELTAYHNEYPLRLGMPREALRSRLGIGGKLFNQMISHSQQSEIGIVDEGAVLRLGDHDIRFSDNQQKNIDELFSEFHANPTSPPSVKVAVGLVGEDVFLALIAQGRITQVSKDVIFETHSYNQLVEQIKGVLSERGTITVSEARDLFGTSRKYVLALLEYLDERGITRRQDDHRVLARN